MFGLKKSPEKIKAISPGIHKLGKWSLFLVVIVILFFVSSKIGFEKLSKQKEEILGTEKNIKNLQKKIEVLSYVEDNFVDEMDFFTFALPENNSSLAIISQIRRFASQYGLALEDIKSGSETNLKSYSSVEIAFDLDGGISTITEFFKDLRNFAPIITIEKIEMNQSGGFYRSKVAVKGYWAEYPKKIPAITQPVSEFTEDEVDMILRISKLIAPPFYEASPTVPNQKTSPFE